MLVIIKMEKNILPNQRENNIETKIEKKRKNKGKMYTLFILKNVFLYYSKSNKI